MVCRYFDSVYNQIAGSLTTFTALTKLAYVKSLEIALRCIACRLVRLIPGC